MEQASVLTYSEIRSWKQCRLQHDYRYRQQLSAKGNDASYGRRGNFVHGYIDRMYAEIRTNRETIDELVGMMRSEWAEACKQYLQWGAVEDDLKKEYAVIEGMVLGYYDYFFLTEQWEGVSTEREVVLEIPDAGTFAIKTDAILKEKGLYWIHDIKTVSGFSEKDGKLLNVDDQFSHYCVIAGEKYNRTFEGGIRTVIKTPGIKQTKKETVDEYCDRVVRDYRSRPDFYMQRIYTRRSPEQLAAYRQYLVRIAAEISQSCTFIFRCPSMQCGMCDYLDLCTEQKPEVHQAILVTDFYKRKKKHSELSIAMP